VKIDILQKSIEAFNYEISESKSEEIVFRLSKANYDILKKYFEKKEIDNKKILKKVPIT